MFSSFTSPWGYTPRPAFFHDRSSIGSSVLFAAAEDEDEELVDFDQADDLDVVEEDAMDDEEEEAGDEEDDDSDFEMAYDDEEDEDDFIFEEEEDDEEEEDADFDFGDDDYEDDYEDEDDEEKKMRIQKLLEDKVKQNFVSYYEGDEPDGYSDDEWEDNALGEEEEGYDYELQDDDDPNYMIQKEIVERNFAATQQEIEASWKREDNWRDFVDAVDNEEDIEDPNFIENFDPVAVEQGEEGPELMWSDSIADKVKALMEGNDDIITVQDQEIDTIAGSFNENRNPDDPINPIDALDATIDEDLLQAEEEKKTRGAQIDAISHPEAPFYDPTQLSSNVWDVNKFDQIGNDFEEYDQLPEETQAEIARCHVSMVSAPYNVTKWFIYDLDFNVTNLMLAACKHNPDAPIMFEHWLPQLQHCERYQYVRDGNFSFTWEDAEQADMEELERYYRGFGYYEIPEKAPRETGIINVGELDEDEVRMVDFAAWFDEVYNPEWDRKDFDDDDIKDVDNVYSSQFEQPLHPDLPLYEEASSDIKDWYEEVDEVTGGEITPEQQKYQHMVAREDEYHYVNDLEFAEAYRGHLIIACTSEEEDLDIAEKITARCQEEFGKSVFVETRIIAHALEEDNVFEIWLESYEVELLHSKRRATTGVKGWTGPVDCDDEEIEKIVDRVGFLVSDNSRYSYRLDMDAILQ